MNAKSEKKINQKVPELIITGASGFLGSRLASSFSQSGYNCKYIVRPGSDTTALQALQGTVIEYTGAIADLIAGIEQNDLIIHTAACSTAEHSLEQVDSLIDSNIRFGTHLLEAMRVKNASKLLLIGTYWQFYEASHHRPVNLYAATKQALEDIARFYSDAYGFSVSALRLYDTYGENDKRVKLINLLLKAGIEQTTLDMSPGHQQLDLMHVNDVVSAIEYSLKRMPVSGFCASNVTSGRLISLRQLVTLIEQTTGLALQVNFGGRPYRAREVMHPTRDAPLPGWQPQISLEEGIKRLYKHHLQLHSRQ